ncbi:MAG: hypothetical protein KKB66_20025 [Alphaproteobacteria bacterium]|nr:hypothetical protein [Alphaproteobacteria bacterium]MBU0803897.1 hypothetical protein [Alphaproteobacteria bacterium]MBU0872806.1 hypothetical protein [Alphaproteobacteria bacterium]MBU1402824.1 hypothetical protein [Alphaproteobacteria bacterium]MBU1593466.1 hypothetical protein [Alphaproteobacteria bacterium]
MNSLIVNERFAKRTGTEIVTRDYSLGLARRGHRVAILTGEAGDIATEVESNGVCVSTDPAAIPFRPDIIHFNDLTMAQETTRAFPSTPAVLQWHRFVPTSFSVEGTNIVAITGVSQRIIEKIARYTGRPTHGLVHNYVDLRRFEARSAPLPARPARWLLVGQQKRGYGLYAQLSWIALKHGRMLRSVGPRYFNRVDNLPKACAEFDLVFASGRCALEACCAGAGVVVTDFNGVGGFLTGDNIRQYYKGNFSYRSFSSPVSLDALNRAIDDYDPAQAARATQWLRENADLEKGIDRLLALYEATLAGKNET